MKITVGDVMNNKANVRKYLSVHPENGKIYVNGACFDVVLIDKTEEWDKLITKIQETEEENKRLKGLLAKIENNMGITDEENDILLEEIRDVLKGRGQLELFY